MRKTMIGKIVADHLTDTAIVEVPVWKVHRIIGKRYRQTKRMQVHNPANVYKVGTSVQIAETRPISKHKSWLIVGLATAGVIKEPVVAQTHKNEKQPTSLKAAKKVSKLKKNSTTKLSGGKR